MIKTKLDRVCKKCLKRPRMKNGKYCYICEPEEDKIKREQEKRQRQIEEGKI